MATESDPERGRFQQWARRSIQNPGRVYRAMFYVAAICFLLTTLFPFYWLFVLALTPSGNLSNMGLTPQGFNIGAFAEVFQVLPFHHYMFNSFVLASMTMIIVLVLGSLAGYAFGRLDFYGRRPMMLFVLAISYFPPAAFLLPLFELFTGNIQILGLSSPELYNTPGAMVMPFSALFMPLAIFILTTFYGQTPDGLEDAARVEGDHPTGGAVSGDHAAFGTGRRNRGRVDVYIGVQRVLLRVHDERRPGPELGTHRLGYLGVSKPIYAVL